MTLSPAQIHKMFIEAQAAGAAYAKPAELSHQQHALLQDLGEDLRKLDKIVGIEAKNAYKRQNIGKYSPYVMGLYEGWLKGHKPPFDEVFGFIFIWYLDLEDFINALKLAKMAIDLNYPLPRKIRRDLPSFLLETMADYGEAAMVKFADFDTNALETTIDILKNSQIADQKRAKIHKPLGLYYLSEAKKYKSEDPNKEEEFARLAHKHLEAAYDYNKGFGAKKELNSLAKRFKKSHPADGAGPREIMPQ